MGILDDSMPEDAKLMADVNISLLKSFCKRLGIAADLIISSNITVDYEDRQDRLVKLMKAVGATKLVFGSGTNSYIDKEIFKKNGLDYALHKFIPVPYRQLGEGFIPYLSILDYVMNMGWSLGQITQE